MSRVVVVTGGGRGIGAATCRLAADRGYAVCLNYRRNADAAERVVDEIRTAGGTVIAVRADVSSRARWSSCSPGSIGISAGGPPDVHPARRRRRLDR